MISRSCLKVWPLPWSTLIAMNCILPVQWPAPLSMLSSSFAKSRSISLINKGKPAIAAVCVHLSPRFSRPAHAKGRPAVRRSARSHYLFLPPINRSGFCSFAVQYSSRLGWNCTRTAQRR